MAGPTKQPYTDIKITLFLSVASIKDTLGSCGKFARLGKWTDTNFRKYLP